MGSSSGLWTSVSGAMAQSQNVDTIANNLANANTSGFKKDAAVFKEYLTAVERPPSPVIDIPRTAFKDSEFYHTDGRENAFVIVDKTASNHSQGPLKRTNRPFDLAVDGPGFFSVRTAAGIRFTRAGEFKVDGQGRLTTVEGHPVLGLGPQAQQAQEAQAANIQVQGRQPATINPFVERPGQPPLLSEINLSPALLVGQGITITETGEVYSGEDRLAKIAVADFVDPRLLSKEGATLFQNVSPANVPRVSEGSNVRQGFLEISNVNAAEELVNLLKANRMYESNMRAIRTYGEMSAKEVNEVGKL